MREVTGGYGFGRFIEILEILHSDSIARLRRVTEGYGRLREPQILLFLENLEILEILEILGRFLGRLRLREVTVTGGYGRFLDT